MSAPVEIAKRLKRYDPLSCKLLAGLGERKLKVSPQIEARLANLERIGAIALFPAPHRTALGDELKRLLEE